MLDLSDLGSGRIPAITPALGNMLAEAAGVCLESQGHAPGAWLVVRGLIDSRYALAWPVITEQAIRSWSDREYATEHGAVGVAVLLADREIGFEVIESSVKGTGFDFWLGESGVKFQRKARLEISGIRIGDANAVGARMREKLRQVQRSDHLKVPAYVIVVEFGLPVVETQMQ